MIPAHQDEATGREDAAITRREAKELLRSFFVDKRRRDGSPVADWECLSPQNCEIVASSDFLGKIDRIYALIKEYQTFENFGGVPLDVRFFLKHMRECRDRFNVHGAAAAGLILVYVEMCRPRILAKPVRRRLNQVA